MSGFCSALYIFLVLYPKKLILSNKIKKRENMYKYIAISGGGTGGHLSIAKIIIDKFYGLNFKVIYIGSTKGADKTWFENYENIEKAYFLPTTGVVDKNIFGKMKAMVNILKQTSKAINILKTHNISKVISVGGFSAAPASFATIVSRKQLFIHEQNSVMGMLNRLCKPFAKEVFGSYDNATYKIDYPVNQIYFKLQRKRKYIKHIIFLGGSQGSVAINNFALKVAPILHKNDIKISHQTGEKHTENIKQSYENIGIKVDCFGFTDKLFDKLEKSDMAVCRAGAGTVWELCAMGLPAIFLPYPYAASNHQWSNAKFLKDIKACEIVDEKNITQDILMKFITNFKQKQSTLMTQQISPNQTDKIIKSILV